MLFRSLTVGEPVMIPVKFRAGKLLLVITCAPVPEMAIPVMAVGEVVEEVSETVFPVMVVTSPVVVIPVTDGEAQLMVTEFVLMFGVF